MEQPSELLERFARGDLDAFESLFRQFQGDVFRWIVRIVCERGAAEDLTIETFWRIHRAHARFDPERNFAAWARRIATNTALDYLKVARREVELPEDLPDLRSSALGDPGVRQDVRERVGKAFGELPAKLRVTATLALIEEEPYQEIADALGISVGAVKLRVFRAVRLLRKQLKQLGVEP
jgi:RNA polymerase sigma-70 factor (ECF subfamily)